MCGIAGLVRFDGLRADERLRGRHMAMQLRHRGPDDIGGYADRCASLGHARLSVIDPAGGHQPMANEDGTIQAVFNGEIYNHRDLAGQLRAGGHQLRTRCDTEVIAHLYEQHGEEFVHRLNGMFAIALWDARRRRLILLRDRMGVKPLYWTHDGQRIAFGSELKAVLAAGDVHRDLDVHALKDYLTFGHVPAPQTIYQGVYKLEPGHLLVCSSSGVRVRPYWDIPFAPHGADASPRPESQWVEDFAALLDDAVAMRLEADVPLGAFLSGGVDSAAIVTGMCRHARGPVLTHTVGFEECAFDEREPARRLADRLGTDHREVLMRADAVETARRLVGHFDEPFADSCAVPAFLLAQAARERVTVALAGDGPDEMLAGYRRYRFDLAESAARALAPAWLRRGTFGVAGRLYPKADWLPRHCRAKRTLQNLAVDDATAHLRSIALNAGELPDLLLAPDLSMELADHDSFARGRDLFARCASSEPLDRLLYLDMKTLLVDDILTKVDRTSMAVGLEVRVPFLDYRLVELSARLPVALKLSQGVGKRVVRQVLARWLDEHPGSSDATARGSRDTAAAGLNPASRAKQGFDVPTDAWFRGPLQGMLRDQLLSSKAMSHQWLDRRTIEGLLQDHTRGARNNGSILWTLFMLEEWAQTCLTSAPTPFVGQDSPAEVVCV